jgi:hypothetical protein
VTFTAVVLGLLISNVKSSYDQFDSRLSAFASDIIELDVRLREYGEDAAPIRAKLRTYLAASIADTWRNEPPPSGAYPRFAASPGLGRQQLGDMLIDADIAIRKLEPSDSFRKRLVTQIENRMSETMNPTPASDRNLSRHDLLEPSRRHDRLAGDRLRRVRPHRAPQRAGLRDNPLVRAFLFVRDFLHTRTRHADRRIHLRVKRTAPRRRISTPRRWRAGRRILAFALLRERKGLEGPPRELDASPSQLLARPPRAPRDRRKPAHLLLRRIESPESIIWPSKLVIRASRGSRARI